MRRQQVLSVLSIISLLFIATVCGEPAGAPHAVRKAPEVIAAPPELAITDGRDEGGVAHFYFLEPVDRRPKDQRLGAPDRSLEKYLTLEICLWTSNGCAEPLLARYTSTSGVGHERLGLDDDDDYYKVRWFTSQFPSVTPGQTYRLTVLAAGMTLGSADVQILKRKGGHRDDDERGDHRNGQDNFVGVKDDEGLTIRFYIEKCGVYVVPGAGGAAKPCASGSIIATDNQLVGLIVPPGVAGGNTSFTIQPSTGTPADAGVMGGPYSFGPTGGSFTSPVVVSMAFDPARVKKGVLEATLGAYEMRDGAWRVSPGATLDAIRNRISFPVRHFSQYAVQSPVASISLAMPGTKLAVGATAMAVATLKDAAGSALLNRQVDWSAFPVGIVTVDATGKITAVAPGTATVTATSEGIRAAASVDVGGSAVASVAITGGSTAPLILGSTLQLSATASDAKGVVLTGRTTTWTSSADAVASVDATGLVTTKAAGSAVVTATIDGVTATSNLTVQLPKVTAVTLAPAVATILVGATQQLTAAVVAGTAPQAGRTTIWKSSSDAIATVDANGLVTGKSTGDATITATVDGVSGTSAISVRPVVLPVTTVAVTATAIGPLDINTTRQLTATAYNGTTVLLGRATTWSSSNPNVASVDANGLVTAKVPGDAIITATVEGIGGTNAISVQLPKITAVTVTSPSPAVVIGGTQQLTVVAMAGTAPQSGRAVAWRSSNDAMASVSSTGMVTGKAVGSVTITATVDGVAGSVGLTVLLPTVTRVDLAPNAATVVAGDTKQLAAKVWAGDVEQSGRVLGWASSNDAIASVDANGLVTAKTAGDAVITASVDGVTGASKITVTLPAITAVTIDPRAATMILGGASQQLSAIAVAGAATQGGRAVTWRSSSDAIASVDSKGLVTAVGAGVATITATVDGVSGASTITVQLPAITSVEISPKTAAMLVGDIQQLVAVAKAGGVEQGGRSISWLSSNDAVATVSATGLVTARSAGDVTITATVDGISASSTVSVRPVILPVTSVVVTATGVGALDVSGTRQFTAASYNGVALLPGRAVTWSSSNTSVASVDANGLVTANAPGDAVITAKVEGVSGTSAITVQLPRITAVNVTSPSPTLVVAKELQLKVVATAGQAVQDGRAVSWTSSNDATATVSASGLVTGKGAGTVTITANVEGVTGSVTLTVQLPAVTRVDLTPNAATLVAEGTQQLSASVWAGDAEQSGRVLSWASSNNAIASVDANGLVTAHAAGDAVVTASVEGVTGASRITVNLPAITSVSVDPQSATMVLGGAPQQLAATALAGSATQSGRAVSWTSSSDAIATVDGNGLVTAKGAGIAIITATVGGVSGASTITVQLPAITAVNVTPDAATLVVGGAQQLDAAPMAGSIRQAGRIVTWKSSDDGVATVDGNGRVTATGAGSARVTATSEGVSGSSVITVQLPKITSVDISPLSATILVGGTQPFAAVGKVGDALQPGRSVAWISSSSAIATVDGNGLVTGVSAGDATITATIDGVSASAAVSVHPVPVTAVTVSSTISGVLDVGATRQFAAAAFNGTAQLTGRGIAWSTSDVNIATIDQNGLLTATSPGDVTVIATVEGVTGSSALTVQLPKITEVIVDPASATLLVSGTQQLGATAKAGSVQQNGRSVMWSSSNDAVASVDANGLVTAHSAGAATITAMVDGVSGASTITVELPKITEVKVDPTSASILVGGVQQLSATALAAGVLQSGRSVSWISSNAAVATVDGLGLVTAKGPGDATITATVEGVSGNSAITVQAVVVPVTSVVVSSTTLGPLDVGSTRQYNAAAFNGTAGQLFGRTTTWATSDANIATVDANGFVTAMAAGNVTITATVDGVTGTSALLTMGLPFGPYHIDQSLFGAPFTGALRQLKAADGIAMLNAARRAGMRLIITPVSGRDRFKDPVTGRFRLDLWKQQLDQFIGMDFRPYIADGTIIGIYLIDEPMDKTNWVNSLGPPPLKAPCMTDGINPVCLLDANGNLIPDQGEPVSYADIDAAAAYAERFFPGVPMGVGSRPSQLQPGAPFQNLDFGLAQYTTNKKDTQNTKLSPDQFVAYEVAAARQAGLGVQLSINVIAGYNGNPVPAGLLRSWGIMMANEPYACALTMWKWDAVDKGTATYNSYWTDPANVSALRDIAAVAAKHKPVTCRPH